MKNKGYTLVELLAVLAMGTMFLAVIGFLIVGAHFVMKFW